MVNTSEERPPHFTEIMISRVSVTKKQQIIGLISVLAVGAGVYFSRCETSGGYTLWIPIFGGSEITCPYRN